MSVPTAPGIWQIAVPLTPTAVKPAAYTAAPADFVPVDTTGGAVTVTLPAAPADKTEIAVKHVIQGSANAVTVACGGSDVFNKTSGSTSLTLPLLNQAVILQYNAAAGIWYVLADALALAQLDLRFAKLDSPALTGTPTAPTATPGTNTTQVATTAYADAIAALKANLASPTFTGTPAAPTADPNTNSTQVATTAYADEAGKTSDGSIPTGGIVQSYPRRYVLTQAGTTTSATMRRSGLVLVKKGQTITKLNMYIGSTGISASGASHYWMCLLNGITRAKIQVTDDKTTAAWTANTWKAFTLASPWTAPSDTIVQAGLVVVGVAPTVPCMTAGAWVTLVEDPPEGGITESGLTDPASCPSTMAAIATGNSPFYWWAT